MGDHFSLARRPGVKKGTYSLRKPQLCKIHLKKSEWLKWSNICNCLRKKVHIGYECMNSYIQIKFTVIYKMSRFLICLYRAYISNLWLSYLPASYKSTYLQLIFSPSLRILHQRHHLPAVGRTCMMTLTCSTGMHRWVFCLHHVNRPKKYRENSVPGETRGMPMTYMWV